MLRWLESENVTLREENDCLRQELAEVREFMSQLEAGLLKRFPEEMGELLDNEPYTAYDLLRFVIDEGFENKYRSIVAENDSLHRKVMMMGSELLVRDMLKKM